MATIYTEIPNNFNDIKPFVKSDVKEIINIFFHAERIVFYDACSFQRHSNLEDKERSTLINYFKKHGSIICITRCVLMELSSDFHKLAEEQINFIKSINEAGITVVIFNEEYPYNILSECFSTNEKINEYLVWAVRNVISPVSTIQETLKKDAKLYSEIVEAKNIKQSSLYNNFFKKARKNKEHGDNLGEELIAICVQILSYLPGVADGKLCVLTDDKGAAGKIDNAMKRIKLQYRGAKIILFSTPKLIQHMFQEKIIISEAEMIKLISNGSSGNIVVMGTTVYDLHVNDKISMSSVELVKKIMEPNGINIVF